ncbi:MAG: hypothetical protein II942_04860 [Alphaproteobacteria bacterium]|nr:hypothetical protein [Alphaproteobacteria bacterium]
MKNNRVWSFVIIAIIIIAIMMIWYRQRTTRLYTAMVQAEPGLSQLHKWGTGLNFKGDALIFYHAQHPRFPDFIVQRMKVRDTFHQFDLELRGINGFVLAHLRRQNDFEGKLWDYQPQKDLLNNLMLTLGLMGYDRISFDLSLNAKLNAPNQMFVQLNVVIDGKPKMHFVSKITPPEEHQTLWANLKHQPIKMQLDYIDPEWKERLDHYTQSKKIEFLTEQTLYPLALNK